MLFMLKVCAVDKNQMTLSAAGACLLEVSVITGHEKLFYASCDYIYDQKL